jgi:hypothetical protein
VEHAPPAAWGRWTATPAAPSSAIYPVSGYDFFQYCTPDVGAPIDNRGVELDWLRFFFDLDHTEGVPFRDIVESYAEAVPSDWNADDTGDAADDPRPRLEAAFGNNGFGNAWDNQLHNGIWR